MPYAIEPYKTGYRLVLLKDPTHLFSYKPMTKEQVRKQMQAIEISKHMRGGIIPVDDVLKMKPSAYKSMLLSKYGLSKTHYDNKDLINWKLEKWQNLTPVILGDDKFYNCGNKSKLQKEMNYPSICRPSRKITKSTPELGKTYNLEQLKRALEMKIRGERINWRML